MCRGKLRCVKNHAYWFASPINSIRTALYKNLLAIKYNKVFLSSIFIISKCFRVSIPYSLHSRSYFNLSLKEILELTTTNHVTTHDTPLLHRRQHSYCDPMVIQLSLVTRFYATFFRGIHNYLYYYMTSPHPQ